MDNIIFYFTGTGNRLMVAQDIADKIGDTKLMSIADAVKEDNIDLTYVKESNRYDIHFS